MIEQLFFELIRVALGTQETLSRPPSKVEWAELYAMAKKQSLVGICFAAFQKLQCNDNQEPSTQNPQPNSTQNQEPITHNLDEVQYLTWMGMAAKIQQRNETVNKECVELQKILETDGLQLCIMKGQSVALIYDSGLSMLRQSGDIDVWIDLSPEECLQLASRYSDSPKINDQHVELEIFVDTEVELHYVPCHLHGYKQNRRLEKWLNEIASKQYTNRNELGFCSPTSEFNLVYMLIHMYRHVFGEGLGLRQMLDYYFVLKNADTTSMQKASAMIEMLGLKRFATGVMWIMREVFCLKQKEYMFEASEHVGHILLREVEIGGNFGRYRDDDKFLESSNLLVRQVGFFEKNMRLFALDPKEIINLPLWSVYHWFRKRIKGY